MTAGPIAMLNDQFARDPVNCTMVTMDEDIHTECHCQISPDG